MLGSLRGFLFYLRIYLHLSFLLNHATSTTVLCTNGEKGKCIPCGNCHSGLCDETTGQCKLNSSENSWSPHCKPGYKPNKCLEECDDGSYGTDCRFKCNNCKGTCNKTTGCTECFENFDKFCLNCNRGYFKNENICVPCGKCMNKEICNGNSGACPQIGNSSTYCVPNYKAPQCLVCVDGFYGNNCKLKCNNNCLKGLCDTTTGCKKCVGNFDKNTQCLECKEGYYGASCKKCTNCALGKCDRVKGCVECTDNFDISNACKSCKIGFFKKKDTCVQCGHCLSNQCIGNNGDCIPNSTFTCYRGYKPPICLENCDDGTYGDDCLQKCTKNCEICDHKMGCTVCKDNFSEPMCLDCKSGFYLKDNSTTTCKQCGNCFSGVCDKYNGSCGLTNDTICQERFVPPLCQEKKNPLYLIYLIVVIIAAFLIIAIIFILTKLRPCHHNKTRNNAAMSQNEPEYCEINLNANTESVSYEPRLPPRTPEVFYDDVKPEEHSTYKNKPEYLSILPHETLEDVVYDEAKPEDIPDSPAYLEPRQFHFNHSMY